MQVLVVPTHGKKQKAKKLIDIFGIDKFDVELSRIGVDPIKSYSAGSWINTLVKYPFNFVAD